MIRVLVTGANGQLGSCIKQQSLEHPDIVFHFLGSNELNITDPENLRTVFSKPFDYCINCAAYTQVDNAESNSRLAHSINENGVKELAKLCHKHNVVLIHISTDFVFDGKKRSAYTETDHTNPLGVYGLSKLKGEQAIERLMTQYFILRTSWLYSEHGNNFVKTMLRLAKERDSISVVNDQFGSPTYAMDLAKTIVKLVSSKSDAYGLYHYSNHGQISWFDFASKVFEFKGISISLKPIKTADFPTLAKRPKFSVLDTTKIQENIKAEINDWEESLQLALTNMYGS
ncbi:dTDP-4-dehydrorhamnose reductase [Winogradskyella aurantiaca]|uniref:dTDP-4-dehydrorhamnose reductase n=1 Tax=Winogradskyella aurantiaca TaxID=2219558 RepID=UPI000E1DF455|nr:dTDP-4-dehydrorhamnose reductase [Winogradskyella aurantiaca]